MKILNKQKKKREESDHNLLYKGSRHSPTVLVPYKYKYF